MKKYLHWIPAIIWAILIWRLTTIPDFKVTSDSLLSAILSNGGHFFFFGVLAILLLLPRFWALMVASGYGLLIELVQRSIPGRSFSLFDWLLDTLGAVAFLLALKKLQSKL